MARCECGSERVAGKCPACDAVRATLKRESKRSDARREKAADPGGFTADERKRLTAAHRRVDRFAGGSWRNTRIK